MDGTDVLHDLTSTDTVAAVMISNGTRRTQLNSELQPASPNPGHCDSGVLQQPSIPDGYGLPHASSLPACSPRRSS